MLELVALNSLQRPSVDNEAIVKLSQVHRGPGSRELQKMPVFMTGVTQYLETYHRYLFCEL